MTTEPARADLLADSLLEVHAALASALHVPLDQINPNALPDYIRELARQAGTISRRQPPGWFSRQFDEWQVTLGEPASWLNELEERPDVDFVAEVVVHGAGAVLLVLARVIWQENRP